MSSSDPNPQLYARTNPYRPFPTDQTLHDTLCEILFIEETISNGMLPTSLPDDDYSFYSTLLRSLETRVDITWLIAAETQIFEVISRIANRKGPFPPEPEELFARCKRLALHWKQVQRLASTPSAWDPEFDTEIVPPLINLSKAPKKLQLTTEQVEEAAKRCARHLRIRTKYVAHFARNPPEPMTYVPVARNFARSEDAWARLYETSELPERLHQECDVSLRWKPVYMPARDQCYLISFQKEDLTESDMRDLREDLKLDEMRREMRERREEYQRRLEWEREWGP